MAPASHEPGTDAGARGAGEADAPPPPATPGARRRGPRRADAGPGRPGSGDPAPAGAGAGAGAGDDATLLPARAAEDTGHAWGDDDGDSNDERLLRDRPPHWG